MRPVAYALPPEPYSSAPFTATTHPFSALSNPLVHIMRTAVAVREQVRRGQPSMLGQRGRWDGERTVAAQAGRMDRHPSVASTTGFSGCLHVSAASPSPDGRLDHTPRPLRYTASTARRRDSLECSGCSERWGLLRRAVCARVLPRVCQNPARRLNQPPCQHSAGGRHSNAWSSGGCSGCRPVEPSQGFTPRPPSSVVAAVCCCGRYIPPMRALPHPIDRSMQGITCVLLKHLS